MKFETKAASGYGDQKYREGSGDRILYHVAGKLMHNSGLL